MFIYLFIFGCAGLRCCVGPSLVVAREGSSLVAAGGLLVVAASLAARAIGYKGFSSCNPWAPGHRLRSCGTRAQLPRRTWDLPAPGTSPVSLALAGGFFTTEPPGKLLFQNLFAFHLVWKVKAQKPIFASPLLVNSGTAPPVHTLFLNETSVFTQNGQKTLNSLNQVCQFSLHRTLMRMYGESDIRGFGGCF